MYKGTYITTTTCKGTCIITVTCKGTICYIIICTASYIANDSTVKLNTPISQITV